MHQVIGDFVWKQLNNFTDLTKTGNRRITKENDAQYNIEEHKRDFVLFLFPRETGLEEKPAAP